MLRHAAVAAFAICLYATLATAQALLPVDDMEDLAAWKTGGQKEATLRPERTLVTEGKQALRFDVKIDHNADESIEGKQYPKGWPRVERNPAPPLDLSAAGRISFDIYALSSRPGLPGNSLHIILRDRSGSNWSATLGSLPLRQWKHLSLDLGSFARSAIVHWQFFLSESDYGHGDTVSFVIDNVRGEPARRFRSLLPAVAARAAALQKLSGPRLPARLAAPLAALVAEASRVQQRGAAAATLDLPAANAFDTECQGLLDRLQALAMEVGAAATSPDGSYCVGTESGLRKVMRDDVSFTPGNALRLSVAGNERESGQILVRPLSAEVKQLDAEWTELTGPGGAKLPRSLVSVQAVGYIEVLKANYARERDGWWPDPLLPLDWPGSGHAGLGPLADNFAKTGETQPLWVTVTCPAGTRPGLYTGTITLKPRGLPASQVSLKVQVRSFSLPLRPRLKTAFAFFEGEYRNYYGRPLDAARRHEVEQFLLSHRLNPMNLYTPYAWPGLQDLPDLLRRGLNAYCLGYCPDTVEKFGDLAYYRYLRDYLAALARTGHYDDAWLYGYDEPHCRPDFEQLKPVMREVYAMVDAVAPGLPKASTTAVIPDLYGAVNLWIPQTMQVVRADTLGRQKAGDQVWTYVACTPPHPFANYFIEYAALEQRLLGWQTWQEQCTGFLYYATNLWRPNYEAASPPAPSPTPAQTPGRGGEEKAAGGRLRWPDKPFNPRPEKDFAFNGDGLLIYPHPDGSLLSSVRLEAIGDGFEDYDYLCLLRDAAQALKATGKHAELVKQAQAATVVPPAVSVSLTEYNHEPAALLAQREKVAGLLEQVQAALPAATWQRVVKSEPPLYSRAAPLAGEQLAAHPLPLAWSLDRPDPYDLQPWTAGKGFGATATLETVEGARGKAAVSRGGGRGWADWESPHLKVTPGQTLAVRFSARPDYKRGLVRVLLFKYGADGLPLDLPTRQQGDYAPALLDSLPSTGLPGRWEKHRLLTTIPEGVSAVRLYLQCFGLDGSVAFDDLSVEPYTVDPSQVDDCDEVSHWRPGFPESSVSRETQLVRQGDAALRYTVKVNHKGGEEKYPVGWPSLTWELATPLNLAGKQALTFWVYATSSRAALPRRALNFTLRSKPGDELAFPLTFELGTWQQVRLPLAGKQLGAVNRLHFFLEEVAYQDGDEVSFVLDDLRVE